MTASLRVVFFGTPDFAVPSLGALRRRGASPFRSSSRSPTAPSAATRSSGRPRSARSRPRAASRSRSRRRSGATHELLARAARRRGPTRSRSWRTAGSSRPRSCELPRLGCVNVHASLLPRHRGASPVQAAILAGDPETGVDTMRMEEELDAGPVYLERRVRDRRAGDRGRALGAARRDRRRAARRDAARDSRPGRSRRGRRKGSPRSAGRSGARTATRTGPAPPRSSSRRLRAYTPWPGLYTFLGAERIKILEARAVSGRASRQSRAALRLEGGRPGRRGGRGHAAPARPPAARRARSR